MEETTRADRQSGQMGSGLKKGRGRRRVEGREKEKREHDRCLRDARWCWREKMKGARELTKAQQADKEAVDKACFV